MLGLFLLTFKFSLSNGDQWGQWSTWGACSITCGEGTQTRSRLCLSPIGCTGDFTETRICSTQTCPDIPTVVIRQTLYNVNFGNSVILVCDVTSNLALTSVFWGKNQNGVTNYINVANSNNKYSGSTVNNPYLQINNVVLSDEGYYVCFAVNDVGPGQSSPTFLDVKAEVTGVNIPLDQYVTIVGHQFTLQCLINNSTDNRNVYWYRDKYYITVSQRYSGGSLNNPSLTLQNVQLSDAGIYKCQLSTRFGFSEDTTQLTVLSVSVVSQTIIKTANDTVTLVCNATGGLTLKWKRNGEYLTTTGSDLYGGGTIDTPSLTMTKLTRHHAGNYTCETSYNSVTAVSKVIHLVVEDIPLVETPRDVIQESSDSNVQLDCIYESNPSPIAVFWKKDGVQVIINSTMSKYNGSKVSHPALVIINTDPTDSGIYQCVVENKEGKGYSTEIQLVISDSKSNTNRENESKTGPIVGGIVAGVVAFLILAFLLFRWKRNTQRATDYETQHWRANEDHMYTEPTTVYLYSNPIADNALNSSSEQLDEKPNEEINIILGKIDAPMLTAFLQDKHIKKDVLQREFQWLHLNKTSRTETGDKYVSIDDKRGQNHTYYNRIDRSLESNRNILMVDKGQRSIIQELPGQENVESFWQMVDDFEVECIILLVQKKEKIPDFYPVTDESFEFQTLNIELSGAEKFENVFVYSFKIHNKVKMSYRYIKLFKTSDWKENQKYPSVEQLCSLLVNVDKEKSASLVIIGSKPYGFPTCGVVSVCLEVMMAIEKDQMFSILELAVFVSAERDLFTYFEEYELCYNLIQHYLETAHTYDLIE